MKNKKLSIIYRVCDRVNVCSAYGRCFQVTKNTLIKKCLDSLKANIENIDTNIDFKFICVYDNCSDDILKYIKTIYQDTIMIPLETTGNANSFCKCVNVASKMDDDEICYFLEDDYLFLKNNVLNNIVNNMLTLSEYNGRTVAMMPDDYPDRYNCNRIDTECRITKTGHFLRIDKTTCTFVMFAKDVKENYDNLMMFKYWPRIGENESVNKCWKTVPLYQPIPAYTLHSQIKSVIPIYLDFNKLKRYFEE